MNKRNFFNRKHAIRNAFIIVATAFSGQTYAMELVGKACAGGGGGAAAGALIGAPLGPVGVAGGTALGFLGGAYAGIKAAFKNKRAEIAAEQAQERDRLAAQERARLAEREIFVHRDRIGEAMTAEGEYSGYNVLPADKARFEAFERGESSITIGRRAYFDNVAVKLSAIEERIKQKMLTLRQINGRPVDGYTGNFVELNARYAVANQNAINNPTAESLRINKAQFENPQLNQLFQDIQELFIVGNLFNRTSNIPIEILKDVAVNIQWATANAYAHPLMQALDQTRLDLQELRDLLAERNRVLEESNRLAEQRGQRIDQLNEEKAGIIAAARRKSGEYRAQLLEKEAENARMREEITQRRRRSLEYREMIAKIEAEKKQLAEEKEKVKKDLAASRDAFASCTLTNKP